MKNQQQNEFNTLDEIISKVFDVDMHVKKRDRIYVNARMSFSNILVSRGYSKSSIARYMGKNHATIIHYAKCFDSYIKTDVFLRERHNEALNFYNNRFNPVYDMDRKTLIDEVSSLNKEISSLYCTIETYKEKEKKSNTEASRMDSIIKLVSQRTHHGKEKEVERKLNTLFNGIHN